MHTVFSSHVTEKTTLTSNHRFPPSGKKKKHTKMKIRTETTMTKCEMRKRQDIRACYLAKLGIENDGSGVAESLD